MSKPSQQLAEHFPRQAAGVSRVGASEGIETVLELVCAVLVAMKRSQKTMADQIAQLTTDETALDVQVKTLQSGLNTLLTNQQTYIAQLTATIAQLKAANAATVPPDISPQIQVLESNTASLVAVNGVIANAIAALNPPAPVTTTSPAASQSAPAVTKETAPTDTVPATSASPVDTVPAPPATADTVSASTGH